MMGSSGMHSSDRSSSCRALFLELAIAVTGGSTVDGSFRAIWRSVARCGVDLVRGIWAIRMGLSGRGELSLNQYSMSGVDGLRPLYLLKAIRTIIVMNIINT